MSAVYGGGYGAGGGVDGGRCAADVAAARAAMAVAVGAIDELTARWPYERPVALEEVALRARLHLLAAYRVLLGCVGAVWWAVYVLPWLMAGDELVGAAVEAELRPGRWVRAVRAWTVANEELEGVINGY